jgi:hypothetical protein
MFEGYIPYKKDDKAFLYGIRLSVTIIPNATLLAHKQNFDIFHRLAC